MPTRKAVQTNSTSGSIDSLCMKIRRRMHKRSPEIAGSALVCLGTGAVRIFTHEHRLIFWQSAAGIEYRLFSRSSGKLLSFDECPTVEAAVDAAMAAMSHVGVTHLEELGVA